MPIVEIEYRPFIVTDNAKDGIAVKTEKIDGCTFWKILKSDHAVARLITGQSDSKKRPLKSTSVIEDIITLRNEKIEEMSKSPGAQHDLGIDDDDDAERPTKMIRKSLESLPKIVTIDTKQYGTIESRRLRVRAGLAKDPLWLELVPDVISYLIDVCDIQIKNPMSQYNGSVDKSKVKGVYFDKRRKSWRAQRPDGKQKYFNVRAYEECLLDAYDMAVAWQSGDEFGEAAEGEEPRDDEDGAESEPSESRQSPSVALGAGKGASAGSSDH